MQNNSFIVPKAKQLGRWCKMGAWCALGLGMLSAIFNAISAWHEYIQIQSQIQLLSQNIDGIPNVSNNAFVTSNYSILPYLAEICQNAILPMSIFIVLFTVGTVFTTLANATTLSTQDTEDIVYEPLVPVKMRE